MPATKKEAAQPVDDYIHKLPEWSKKMCLQLRQIILAAHPSITEEWKWGPHYSSNGMMCGIGAFQKHIKLTFFNGAAMQDRLGLFNHCLDNSFLRSIKYTPGEEIDAKALTAYIQESVAINAKGFKREIKDKTVAVPPELTAALAQSKSAQQFFESLGYGYKKEFAEHVSSAKLEKTKGDRIAKIVALCSAQQTLHHKYKK